MERGNCMEASFLCRKSNMKRRHLRSSVGTITIVNCHLSLPEQDLKRLKFILGHLLRRNIFVETKKKLDDLANNSAGNKDTVNHQKSDGTCF